MLSLKVSVFVYESYACTEYATGQMMPSDIAETEGEEKEIEELEDQMMLVHKGSISSSIALLLSSQSFSIDYNSRHQDYTTPPPKQG